MYDIFSITGSSQFFFLYIIRPISIIIPKKEFVAIVAI